MRAFEITNIFAGWLRFAIHGVEYENELSYLDNVKDEFDNLFNLEDNEKKHYVFDMESYGSLLMITYRYNDYIYIYLTDLYKENNHVFKHKYKSFLKSYIKEWEDRKEDYIRDFMYHDADFEWNTPTWQELKDRLSKKK